MSRIREQYDLTGDNTAAVATGLQRTGGIITSAALLLLVVIGAFSLSGITFIKMIGVAMMIAVVMDATIVRILLVPATMRLLGGRQLVRARTAAPAVRPLRDQGERRRRRSGAHRAGAGRRRTERPGTGGRGLFAPGLRCYTSAMARRRWAGVALALCLLGGCTADEPGPAAPSSAVVHDGGAGRRTAVAPSPDDADRGGGPLHRGAGRAGGRDRGGRDGRRRRGRAAELDRPGAPGVPGDRRPGGRRPGRDRDGDDPPAPAGVGSARARRRHGRRHRPVRRTGARLRIPGRRPGHRRDADVGRHPVRGGHRPRAGRVGRLRRRHHRAPAAQQLRRRPPAQPAGRRRRRDRRGAGRPGPVPGGAGGLAGGHRALHGLAVPASRGRGERRLRRLPRVGPGSTASRPCCATTRRSSRTGRRSR